MGGTEFWRGLAPVPDALEPDAQPEVFHQFAPSDDERYYLPLSPTVLSLPLWISPRDNFTRAFRARSGYPTSAVRPGGPSIACPRD